MPPLASLLLTLAIGATGAALGYALSLPVWILTGPAIATSIAGLAGARLAIPMRLRDVAFLVIGITIGAGVTPEALQAIATWPVAFVILALMLWAVITACRILLPRFFGFTPPAAILASSPGHLSYVLALGASIDADVARISLVQSIRLLSLVLIVPLIALLLGLDLSGRLAPEGTRLALPHLGLLLIAAVALGAVLARLRFPAPLLLGGLFASTIGHASGLTPGAPAAWITLPAFALMGTLIGTRFSGVTLAALRQSLAAGAVVTLTAVAFAALAALPTAYLLDMPPAHVLVAFAPGGLETMIAMGVVLGANPGFVAASHVARLFILTFLVPVLMNHARGPSKNA